MDITEIMKSGEQIAYVGLRRGRNGLIVAVKTHPMIEDLMREWGGGEKQDVIVHGRLWSKVGEGKGEGKLEIWNLLSDPGTISTDQGSSFRLSRPGQALIESGSSPNEYEGGRSAGETVNLAFLRIVGISEGEVRFGVRGVYTDVEISKMLKKINEGIRRFYYSYLRPVDLNIQVFTSMQEVR